MNKSAFLKTLRKQLRSLTPAELQKNIGYYDEMIADMTENGLSEEAAVQKIGTPEAVAQEILSSTAPENLKKKDIPGRVLVLLSILTAAAAACSFIRAHLLMNTAVSIIGGADGPTSIFIAGKIGPSIPLCAAAGVLVLITVIYFLIRRRR